MKWVGQGVIGFGLFLIWSGSPLSDLNNPQFFLPWIGLGGVLLLSGSIVLYLDIRNTERKRHKFAAQVFGALDTQIRTPGERVAFPTFALYLRPFDISGKFTLSRENMNLFNWGQYSRFGTDSFERLIADAVEPATPLIGLGGGDENVVGGIGQAGLFENWQERIDKAIGAAQCIFVVPATNEGTCWEIGRLIQSRALSKTIFLMPPANHLVSNVGDYAAAWAATAAKLHSEMGLSLPVYGKDGALFSIQPVSLRPNPLIPAKLKRRALAAGIDQARRY
jgi:hypothetical protein